MSINIGNNKYQKIINNWQVTVPVTACIPALSVISWSKSIETALLNTNILSSYFIATDPLSSAKPMADTVLSTATGSFIALGINRWASMYTINPSAYCELNDIPFYYYYKSAEQLQALAGQYFNDIKNATDDIVTMPKETFYGLARSKITVNPNAMPIILKYAFNMSAQDILELPFEVKISTCIDYLWTNTQTLKGYIKDNITEWATTNFTVNSSVSADIPITPQQ